LDYFFHNAFVIDDVFVVFLARRWRRFDRWAAKILFYL